jgi:negative regulator of genetic competence, sporulation and motility
MDIKYGIIAYELTDDTNEILVCHFCGYEQPPTNNEFLALTDELNTDSEFGLVGRIGVDVFLMQAPQDVVDTMEELNKKDHLSDKN